MPPAEGCPAVPFLHGVRSTVVGTRYGQVCTKNQKGRTFGTRRQAKPEGIAGIRNQGPRQQLRLGSRAKLGRIFRKIAELEVARHTVATSIRLRKMSVTGHCGGVGPLRNGRRDGTQSRADKCRSTDRESKTMVINLDRVASYRGSDRDERP
jgi:hypothetical protein